jgi:alkylation response protein AidB-like acyl-CoA dehydrogenase
VVIGAGLIAECGSEAQKRSPAADGSLCLAFAHSERAAPRSTRVETAAMEVADGWQLDGRKTASSTATQQSVILGPRRQRDGCLASVPVPLPAFPT